MREIKFRGKSKNTGDWLYGVPVISVNDNMYLIHSATEDAINTFNDVDFVYSEVIPETVGQLTGLKGKNGVEIYEGDIFRYHAHRGYTLPDFTGHVIFENGSFGFIIDPPFNGEMIKYFSDIDELKEDFLDHIEVISNIHDKAQQKQALIDMMRGDEELGLYDE